MPRRGQTRKSESEAKVRGRTPVIAIMIVLTFVSLLTLAPPCCGAKQSIPIQHTTVHTLYRLGSKPC